ncbi:hypothetical protein [Entomobacter blattae]|uniref:Uncharacterized protein n=1 Tax=Entomobacter blattae TaxID=2762277 RepID=A0A7H1NQL5_9PROT|nr:hypothetical protein JGUZn3_08430 [Entomobacter blattae]
MSDCDDEGDIVGIRDTVKTTVTGVEMFRKLLDRGEAGDNMGALRFLHFHFVLLLCVLVQNYE